MTTLGLILSGGGPSMAVEGFYVIDFAVYIGLLAYFLRKPLARFMTERRTRIVSEMDAARKARQEAQAQLADYSKRLANLETEIQGILDEARAAAEAQRTQILADATVTADRIRSDAQKRLEQESRKLEHVLRQRTVELSMEIAERIVSDQITDAHRRRFVAEYITDLESRQGQL